MRKRLATCMPDGGFPWWLSSKESACLCRRCGFNPCVGKISQRREWQPTPVFFPGESHRQRNLMGYSSWGHKRVRHEQLNNNKSMSDGSQPSNIKSSCKSISCLFPLFTIVQEKSEVNEGFVPCGLLLLQISSSLTFKNVTSLQLSDNFSFIV